MELIRVIAAVIEQEGRLLVCQRPAHKRHGGLWEFPGGKLEPNENDDDAAKRELLEELSLELQAIGPVDFDVQDPGSAFLIVFRPVQAIGTPVCREHSASRWATLEELKCVALAPADRKYVEYRLTREATPP